MATTNDTPPLLFWQDVRYPFMCGAMAMQFGAELVRKIDRCITNRNIVMAGGGVGHGAPPADEAAPVGPHL
jgi:hypothetical protein